MVENKNFYEADKNIQTFSQYIDYMRQDGNWGNHMEMQAASAKFLINITIFRSKSLDIHSTVTN